MYTQTLTFSAGIDPAGLPSHLADCLRRAEASTVVVDGNRVKFTAGIFRLVPSWNVLNSLSSGNIAVNSDRHEVQYSLDSRQHVLVGTGLTLFLTIFAWFAVRSWAILAAATVWWGWIVAFGLAMGRGRFRWFLRNALDTAPRLAPWASPKATVHS